MYSLPALAELCVGTCITLEVRYHTDYLPAAATGPGPVLAGAHLGAWTVVHTVPQQVAPGLPLPLPVARGSCHRRAEGPGRRSSCTDSALSRSQETPSSSHSQPITPIVIEGSLMLGRRGRERYRTYCPRSQMRHNNLNPALAGRTDVSGKFRWIKCPTFLGACNYWEKKPHN